MGPFDPGGEFSYDVTRIVRELEDEEWPYDRGDGPGVFDPGQEFEYDPSRVSSSRDDAEELEEVEPPWAASTAVADPPAPETEAPAERPPPQPEPQPTPPPQPDPSPPPPADTFDPAPWVPEEPPRPRPPARSRRVRSLPARPRVRVRSLVGFVLVAILATAAASVAGGLPLGPLSRDEGPESGGTGVAAVATPEETSSQAIVADSGPYHPVRAPEPLDYGDSGARFGADRGGRRHEGQDIMDESGTPLIAVRDGVVIDKGNDSGRGNYVGIYSESQDQTYVYLHMLRPTALEPDDQVAAGTQVGAMGCTGSCFGTHLHFEIRRGSGINRRPIDPLRRLERWPQAPEPEASG